MLDVQSGELQSTGKFDSGAAKAQQGDGAADDVGQAEQNNDRGQQSLPPTSDFGQKWYSEFSTFSGEDSTLTLGTA